MKPQALALAAAALLGCVPTFDDRPWLVEEARVIGLSASPAEGRPGDTVTLRALVVDPEGELSGPVEWAFCTRPRTASELGGVSDRCARGESLEVIGNPATILADTCARFGPNPPPAEGDQPPQRPADPDPSGGYYLPFRADRSDLAAASFGFARVRCDLPGVTRAIFEAFEERYTPNVNPSVAGFGLADELTLGATRPDVITVTGELPHVLEVVVDPGSLEDYVVYVANEGALQPRRETLVARWYVTAGTLDHAQVQLSNARAQVQWTPPRTPGPVSAWVVITDDRGGVTWASALFEVP